LVRKYPGRSKGKIKKTYPQNQIMIPYERLQSTPGYTHHLRPGVTPETLEHLATTLSDNQAAKYLQESRTRLFHFFNRRSTVAA